MKTLRNVLAVAMFMFVSNVIFAQGLLSKIESAEEQAKVTSSELGTKLGLNDTQKKAVYDAALTRAKTTAENNKTYSKDKTALEAANKKVNDTYETNVTKVLTPDQKTKYEQLAKDKVAAEKAKLKL